MYSVGMAGAQRLRGKLILARSQLRVQEAQRQLQEDTIEGARAPTMGTPADVAMEVVAALSNVHHAFGTFKAWNEREMDYIVERMGARALRDGLKPAGEGVSGKPLRHVLVLPRAPAPSDHWSDQPG